MKPLQHLANGLGALALAAALAACGGTPGTSYTSPGPAPTSGASTSAASAELKTASSNAGRIVVGANGMSVYLFTKDVKDSGKSACEGACVALWPAVTTASDTPAVDGISGTIGTIRTADGRKQLTINGLPVYYYAGDKAAGDTKGQGFNNLWYLVSPAGGMVKGDAGMGY